MDLVVVDRVPAVVVVRALVVDRVAALPVVGMDRGRVVARVRVVEVREQAVVPDPVVAQAEAWSRQDRSWARWPRQEERP